MRFKCEEVIPSKVTDTLKATALFGGLFAFMSGLGMGMAHDFAWFKAIPLLAQVFAGFGIFFLICAAFIAVMFAVGGVCWLVKKVWRWGFPYYDWKQVYAWKPVRASEYFYEDDGTVNIRDLCVWREKVWKRRGYGSVNYRIDDPHTIYPNKPNSLEPYL